MALPQKIRALLRRCLALASATPARRSATLGAGTGLLIWILFRRVRRAPPVVVADYSAFLQHVKEGTVTSCEFASDFLRFQIKDANGQLVSYRTRPISSLPKVVKLLHEKKISFRQHHPGLGSRLLPVVFASLPFVYLAALVAIMYKMYKESTGSVGKAAGGEAEHAISFDDIAGVDGARDQVMEVVAIMRNPQRYTRVGARLPRGVLLVGPPGTGKTLLARVVAAEAGLPFLFCSGSDFVEVFAGRGASRVRDLFARARAKAPCVLFIDELDALGKRRGGMDLTSNDEREQTLNQLLAAMDGFARNSGVLVMAATNRFSILDDALCRAGRFDRVIRVPLPDAAGRAAILRVHLRALALPCAAVDTELVGRWSPQFAGADLENVVNEAALVAVREDAAELTTRHVLQALRVIQTARGLPLSTGGEEEEEEAKAAAGGGGEEEAASAAAFMSTVARMFGQQQQQQQQQEQQQLQEQQPADHAPLGVSE